MRGKNRNKRHPDDRKKISTHISRRWGPQRVPNFSPPRCLVTGPLFFRSFLIIIINLFFFLFFFYISPKKEDVWSLGNRKINGVDHFWSRGGFDCETEQRIWPEERPSLSRTPFLSPVTLGTRAVSGTKCADRSTYLQINEKQKNI